MLSPAVVGPVMPREAKRRRLTVDQTVEARKSRLRTALHTATVAATAIMGGCTIASSIATTVDALTKAAEEHQRQELAFDEGLSPGLEFMSVMAVSPAAVFRDLLAELGRQLTERLQSSRRDAVERLLMDMLQHVGVACIRDLIASALQRLSEMPPVGELERQMLSTLAEAFVRNRAQLEGLPVLLQRRIWEMKPQLFFAKARPLISEFIRAFRRNLGPLLIELRQKAPEERRRESAALQQLADLIGRQPVLYRDFCNHLVGIFRKAAATGTPAARWCQAEGCATAASDEAEGPPVSVGPEPILSTLRSELLLLLIDRHVLQKSLAGTWEIKSESEGRSFRYMVTLIQRAGVVSGTSKLDGIMTLEGTFQDSKLVFTQHGAEATYSCSCDVSPDMQCLCSGKWHEESRGNQEGSQLLQSTSPLLQGTFSGRRLGPVRYSDASGEVWDELSALVVILDKLHQRKAALDSGILPAIQHIARAYTEAAAAQVPGAITNEDAAFVLIDPCVVQSFLRGLLAIRSDGAKAEGLLATEVRATLQLLLCASQAVPLCCSAGTAVGQCTPLTPSSMDFALLAEGVPSPEALAVAGLRGELLAAALRKHGKKDVDVVVDAGGRLNAELSEALQRVTSGPAHVVLRLLLNTLTNKCLLFRQQKALKECLELSQQHSPRPHDWVQLQQVDMLVGTATQLGEWFDVNLRKLVMDHLFELARRDPWVHYRVAELFVMYQRNFASSREEITALEDMLNNGMLEDAHHKWWRELAQIYLPTVQGKSYLLDIYRNSKLGLLWPADDERLRAPAGPLQTGTAAATSASPLQTISPAPASDAADTTPPAGAGGPGDLARRILGSEDSIMVPGIGDRIKEFCAESPCGERVAETVELLATNFRGYHWLSHLAAKWVVALGMASSTPQSLTAEGLVRSLLRRRMVAEFDPQRADPLLMPINGTPHMPAWLDPFIQVLEWRGVVYELAKQYRGQASSFLSAVLLQISEAESYKEELLFNTSSTSNFIVFCRTLRSELTRFFALLNEDESQVTPAVAVICAACSFSEYTYVYAQAVLHHLMHIRPRERPQLRHVSQSLTEAASEKSDNVLQLDLRFTSTGQYPEVFGILYSMCRLGHEIRIVPADVVRLCGLVEGLLEWKVPMPSASAPPQRSGCDSPAGGTEGPIPLAEAAAHDSSSEHGTEAMSDVGSWLDPEERNVWVGVGSDASEAEDDGDEGEGRSRRVYVSVASSSAAPGVSSAGDRSGRQPPQPATEQSERTASIFNMPAVSSAASGAQVAHGEAQVREAAGIAQGAGVGGVLEALHCPAVLEGLIARFIDPYSPLSTREHRAFARLLAIATVEGLWPADAAERQEAAREAAGVATAAAEELGHVYQVVHHPQHSWLKRLAAMAHFQRHAVASMAGLQWLTQVVLSKQVDQSELLVRMSQSLLFMLLRRACDMHPAQVKSVLGVLRHILELLPHNVSDRCSDEALTGDAVTGSSQRPSALRLRVHHMVATLLTYLILAHGASVPVFEFAHSNMSMWDAEMWQLFFVELLTSVHPPYSSRFASSVVRLLALTQALEAVAGCSRARASALRFCQAVRRPDDIGLETKARPADESSSRMQVALETIEARCLREDVALAATVVPPMAGTFGETGSTSGNTPTVSSSAAAGTTPMTGASGEEFAQTSHSESLDDQARLWEWWSSSSKDQCKPERNLPIAAAVLKALNKGRRNMAKKRTRAKDDPANDLPGTASNVMKSRGSKNSMRVALARIARAADAQGRKRLLGKSQRLVPRLSSKSSSEGSSGALHRGNCGRSCLPATGQRPRQQLPSQQSQPPLPRPQQPRLQQPRLQQQQQQKPQQSTSCSREQHVKPEHGSSVQDSDTESAKQAAEEDVDAETRNGDDRIPVPVRARVPSSGKPGCHDCPPAEVQVARMVTTASCSGGTSPAGNLDATASTLAPRRRLCLRIVQTGAPFSGSDSHPTPVSTPCPTPGPGACPPSSPRPSPDHDPSPSSPMGQYPGQGGEFDLDLTVLQGRWSHSFEHLGELTVQGDTVTFETRLKLTIRMTARGVLDCDGWKASRELSSSNEIVWTKVVAGGERSTCSWRRVGTHDQRVTKKGPAQGPRHRGERR